MRISDWSSDVCSSDLYLLRSRAGPFERGLDRSARQRRHRYVLEAAAETADCRARRTDHHHFTLSHLLILSIVQLAIVRWFVICCRCAGRESYNSRMQRSEEHTSELQSLMRISYA